MKSAKIILCNLFCIVLIINSFSQDTYSIPAYQSVHYKGNAFMGKNEEYQGCQYNIVNVIDSFLYVQLNFAGIEAGKIWITPDSILFINKIQKNFFSGDYSVFKILSDMEIDFYMLQDIFNGNPIFSPEGVEINYQRDSLSYEYPFFKTLTGDYDFFSLETIVRFSLEVNVRKVTFNNVPEVSAVIPKNFKKIELELFNKQTEEF